MFPPWLFETQNSAPFQDNPIPQIHLSVSCRSTLNLTLNNLPAIPQNESPSKYPPYTHYNTSHHYYRYHMKRIASSSTPSRRERKVHIYSPNSSSEGQKVGANRHASDGRPIRLFDGDLILLLTQPLPSESDILNPTSLPPSSPSTSTISLEALIPGLSLLKFFIVCRNRTSLSHLSPDSQIDTYPQSLLNSLQPDQYLSPLVEFSVKVVDYDIQLSSSLVVRELVAILEIGAKTNDRNIILCSQSLLTNV
jgi:hypothetical protein